jgi:hypothetical protein
MLVTIGDGARVFAGLIDITALKIDISGAATEITAAGTSSGSPADGSMMANVGAGGGGSPRSAGGTCAGVAGGAMSTDGRGGCGGTVTVGSASVPGGLGGGVVRLNAYTSLTFSANPTISVAGDPATSQGNTGAGAGGAGTIEVIADVVTGTAKLVADGGSTAGSGGGGAGGLVRLLSSTLSQLPNSVTASTSAGVNKDRTDCPGNPGAILSEPLPANRTRFLCRGGTFDDGAMTVCQQCAAGTSTDQPGSTACAPCGSGTFAKADSVACTQCFPGTFVGGMMANECTPCDIGSEAPSRGSVMCTACKPGTSAPMKGTSMCAPPTPSPTPFPTPIMTTALRTSATSATDTLSIADGRPPAAAVDVALIGGIVGGVIGFVIIVGVVSCVLWRRRSQADNKNENIAPAAPAARNHASEYGMLRSNSTLGSTSQYASTTSARLSERSPYGELYAHEV